MAPELFGSGPENGYGTEVDIWAFGAVVYEVATGLPPNASSRVPYGQLGQTRAPRLEGAKYPSQLRDIAASCLVEDPTKRPTIDQVQLHPYIHSTTLTHPTTTLIDLITAFHIWEESGGARASLFMAGGAAGPSDIVETEGDEDGEWDFDSTLLASAAGDTDFPLENHQPTPRAKVPRRRPPASALAPLRAPIEKLFDPNTLSSYEGNSRAHYFPSASDRGSDLPLRDRDERASRSRDVDGEETLKPPTREVGGGVEDRKRRTQEWTFASSLPAPLDAAETEGEWGTNRRTKDWTFASSLPTVVDPDDSHGEGYAHTPTLSHRAVETNRVSMAESLIDLDISPPLSPTSPPPPPEQNHVASRGSVAESLIDVNICIADSPLAPTTPLQPLTKIIPSSTHLAWEQTFSRRELRELPAPPSVEALSGVAGVDVVRSEMGRLLGGLVVELGVVRDVLAGPGVI